MGYKSQAKRVIIDIIVAKQQTSRYAVAQRVLSSTGGVWMREQIILVSERGMVVNAAFGLWCCSLGSRQLGAIRSSAVVVAVAKQLCLLD